MTGFPLFFFARDFRSAASFHCRSRIQVEASTRSPHVPLVRFHVPPGSRKGLKVLCGAKGKKCFNRPTRRRRPRQSLCRPRTTRPRPGKPTRKPRRHCNAPRRRLRWLRKPTTTSKLRWRDCHFCGTHPQAAFVLRNAARALRKIGEFIVGPFGAAQREEAARFAEVSHLFVAPARLDEIR